MLDVSRTTAYKIVEGDPRLKNCDVHNLARNMNTLMRIGINAQEVRNNIPLLYCCPLTMEHKHGIMRELGLHNLTARLFLQFPKLLKCTVSELKTLRLLPEDYDPRETLLPSLGVPEELIMNISLPCNINQCTLFEVHKELSNVYLCWSLDCDINVLDKLGQRNRIRRSITLQHLTLQQLLKNWSINNEKAALRAMPRIYNLHPKILQDRINLLQEVPVLDALSSHPRVLHLLLRYEVATSRLDLLHHMKKTNAVPSLDALLGSERNFHKYITVGNLKHSKRDVIACLAKDMNESKSTVKDALHFQAWEQHPTVVSVRQNLMILMKKGFTKSQVLSALDVLLYPTELLQDQLAQLPHKLQALPFSLLRSDPHVLQFLLYFMEKSCHV